jgi:hypothetical protein
MPIDTLTEAVANMESAWRRLREVLDGPDVAAALAVARDAPRPMSTAPRDGTWITLHFRQGGDAECRWSAAYESWRDKSRNMIESPSGWSPVK